MPCYATNRSAPITCRMQLSGPEFPWIGNLGQCCRSQSSNRNGKLWAELEENALSNFVETKDHKGGALRNKEMQKAPKKRSPQRDWAAALGERWARTLYAYFNYRTGSVNDLQLLILLNISIILIGGALRHYLVVKDLPTGATPTLGQDLYRVGTCMGPTYNL